MTLLTDIQQSLMSDGTAIAPILLKVRFLASRLGSMTLDDWVRHEAEGYPNSVALPDYRKISVSYVGDFSGPFGSGIRNAPIPSYLIDKFAGDRWTNFGVRQAVSAIDQLVSQANDATLTISCSNLILLLQGKVYEDYACNNVKGLVSKASLVEIQHTVRSRILELTLRLENEVPASKFIEVGAQSSMPIDIKRETVSHITNQIIHGNLTNVHSSGTYNTISMNVKSGDVESFVLYLARAGIQREDAEELGKIVKSEPGGTSEEPYGAKAKKWIARNLAKAVDGTWSAGVSAAGKALTEAALDYYGLR